jgi:aspartokinase-like uncharacterized kinase
VPITWVVKLGGSLAGSDTLPFWLEALADSNVVIVPGGGPFADQVRSAQRRWSFGDETAHAMALLAMEQYGLMLSGLCPKLGTAHDIRELRATAESGRSTVWLPDLSLIDDAGIPASWEVTSDSLAAWLAGRLSAANLLLVKSAAIPSGAASYGELLAQGMVDDAFEYFSAGAAFAAWLGHRQDHPRAREGLREPSRVFTRVDRFTG